MLKGVHLSLMIGPVEPIPVSNEILDALTEVSVTNDEDKTSFQLSFKISNQSPLNIVFLITGGAIGPFFRVVIVATLNGMPNVLADGMITNHEIKPNVEKGTSLLTVTGEDLTVVMDKIDFSGFPFPACPPEARVALMVAKYSFLGIVPLVIPSILMEITLPITRIPSQKKTDLWYIKALADEVGYVFYIDSGPLPGMNIAYWGPQIKVGIPQPALNINMDAYNNVQSLSFSFDNKHNALPIVYYYDELTKIPLFMPIPPVTPLNPPLGILPPFPTSIKPVSDEISKYSLTKAILIGLAKASKWAEAVSGDGELDVTRYGHILKARQLVGVRGAGTPFDGLYYVKSVTHKIKRGEYKQSFKLSRNGLISTIPNVPV